MCRSDRIRVRHVVGAGCYGHNAADDAALDAALLAKATPGRPVLVQWTRADEHRWEPYGAPALVDLRAVVDDEGRITDWSHDVWGTTHASRPTADGPANLLAGAHIDPPVPFGRTRPAMRKEVGIHRNATPIYDLPRRRIVKHFVRAMPLRTSSLRSLGAHANVFAIESFMDELANRQQLSPVEFRLRHLRDERASEVLQAASTAAGWDGRRSTEFGRGIGLGFARYKNRAGYAAVVARLRVDDASSRIVVDRLVIAADCGEVVDPNGLVNQLEGGALQATSWTLLEQVTFDTTSVTRWTGTATRSCASLKCRRSRPSCSTDRASPTSVLARSRWARRPRPSPTPSSTRPDCACATCRSRRNGCAALPPRRPDPRSGPLLVDRDRALG